MSGSTRLLSGGQRGSRARPTEHADSPVGHETGPSRLSLREGRLSIYYPVGDYSADGGYLDHPCPAPEVQLPDA